MVSLQNSISINSPDGHLCIAFWFSKYMEMSVKLNAFFFSGLGISADYLVEKIFED